MDKQTELKQFCKTMWVMTKYEFLPAALVAGSLIVAGWFLKSEYDKGNIKFQNKQINMDSFKVKKNAAYPLIFSKSQEKLR